MIEGSKQDQAAYFGNIDGYAYQRRNPALEQILFRGGNGEIITQSGLE